ncbi:MAG: cytochrome c1 [Ponticaulis sp.]|nr:cytochrome c1 [Ponticaulis sp.]|tara:strand:- start:5020 stop:5919 length:900 start_codon:yes stop_codon:yes gene_type:complete
MKVIKALVTGLVLAAFTAPAALAAGGAKPLHDGKTEVPDWPFEGPFGKFDKASVQRGFQVYTEVCASCHSMKLMSFRNLGENGGPFDSDDDELTEALVKEFAAQYEIDEVDDIGDVVSRPRRASDPFPSPYPNDAAAAAGNGGAIPPDLSVMAKARHGGATYIYRLMTGYPDDTEIIDDTIHFNDDHTHGELHQPSGLYYNPYFAGDVTANWHGDPRHKPYGGFIAMAPQLADGRVSYMDGTEATNEQMSADVAQFIAWASEPKMENRKSLGFAVMIYLFFLALLVYFSYKAIWRNVDH